MLKLDVTEIVIPTYQRGPDDPYPPLTFSGAARGQRRRPYPYHAQDDIDHATMARDDQARHRVVRLSNGLLEALVLPDMNGRLYSLRDLRSGRELFYRNHVVKPGLVALRGAWLSGGVEFNFPTIGHTVSTVAPVFYRVAESEQAVAVTVGDIDRSTRQRWQVTLALRPGRAALDVAVRLANPNHYRERLYFWENAAVPATDDMRFVCRCDWTVGQQALAFPMRDGQDRSWHVNNPNPYDHFGYRSYADFFGAHYRDAQAGTYHVAPRFGAPGQKYFTWGTQTDSHIWERYLTDADRQYVEIQAGLLETQWFTDWLHPQQEIGYEGCWFGTTQAAELTWANRRLGVGVAAEGGQRRLDIVSVDVAGTCRVTVDGARQRQYTISCAPGATVSVPGPDKGGFGVSVTDEAGRLLLAERWHDESSRGLDPQRPRSQPRQWSLESVRRDRNRAQQQEKYHLWAPMSTTLAENQADDLELARGRALLALKTCAAEEAIEHALAGLQAEPGDAELHIIAAAGYLRRLRLDHRPADAYAVLDHALAARTDGRFAAAVLRMIAEAALLQGRPLDALSACEQLVERGAHDPETLALLAGIYRRTGRAAPAQALLARHDSQLWPHLTGERWRAGETTAPCRLPGENTDDDQLRIHQAELTLEWLLLYWRVEWWDDLDRLLKEAEQRWPQIKKHPTALLLHGEIAAAHGRTAAQDRYIRKAATCRLAWTAPHRWEEHALLSHARTRLDAGARRPLDYLYGLLLAEHNKPTEAARLFKRAAGAKTPPALRRPAAVAYAEYAAYVTEDAAEAIRYLRCALRAGPPDRRIVLKLDDLLHSQGEVAERAQLWQQAPATWQGRGDVAFRQARLALDTGRPDEALALMRGQLFSVYEGGTSVRRLYVDALLTAGLSHLHEGAFEQATACFQDVLEFPENLGAARYLGEHSRLARFLLGLAAHRQGQERSAQRWWRDVLQRSAASTTYTVGDVDTARLGRLDEVLALDLAGLRLGRSQNYLASFQGYRRRGADKRSLEIAHAIARNDNNAARRAAALAARYPCETLPRILARLARLRPLAD